MSRGSIEEIAESPSLVSLADIRAAADRLSGVAIRTPLVQLHGRDGDPEVPMFVKLESLQTTGSFKIRGAYNAVMSIPVDRRAAGVVAYSSGNHAQGVARAAKLAGVRAVIVVPRTIPDVKASRIRADGAEIVTHGTSSLARSQMAAAIAEREGLSLIPPYDHADVIAGQGTVGLEIAQDLGRLDVSPDDVTVFVPIGGGGLASGVATALGALMPGITVLGVEPTNAADAAESLATGKLARWPITRTRRTIADGLRTTSLGHIPFVHLRARLHDVVTVDDDRIIDAMARAYEGLRLVLEPSGAAALAAMLDADASRVRRGPMVAILTGGNIDPFTFQAMLTQAKLWPPS